MQTTGAAAATTNSSLPTHLEWGLKVGTLHFLALKQRTHPCVCTFFKQLPPRCIVHTQVADTTVGSHHVTGPAATPTGQALNGYVWTCCVRSWRTTKRVLSPSGSRALAMETYMQTGNYSELYHLQSNNEQTVPWKRFQPGDFPCKRVRLGPAGASLGLVGLGWA